MCVRACVCVHVRVRVCVCVCNLHGQQLLHEVVDLILLCGWGVLECLINNKNNHLCQQSHLFRLNQSVNFSCNLPSIPSPPQLTLHPFSSCNSPSIPSPPQLTLHPFSSSTHPPSLLLLNSPSISSPPQLTLHPFSSSTHPLSLLLLNSPSIPSVV